ncbi:hypothetical protein IJ118_03120 [Candidatus Saccharibacteria bacterium]|nr:hypothetical protein [Candidatus Saccharibacteria bacterium]
MPGNQTNTSNAPVSVPAPSGTSVIVQPDAPIIPDPDSISDSEPAQDAPTDNAIISDVANRINDAHNILIALSSDPSVDEMSAAIGLSLVLDRAGKRATAIYSGQTPNALEFLKPEETFESSADTLQDFVIAINKDKADHLRYKLDGDYVKIFITPYKTRVSEDDLEFSYGDFNIDLVVSLNVANGVDLDSALREYGRIMHDATVINITTGNPGKFGEIEWSNKSASSVSELVTRLLMSMSRRLSIEPDDATALLTGIVAATNHFSNARTTAESMRISSELLKKGANQQLISEHITEAVDNNLFTVSGLGSAGNSDDRREEPAALSIEHGSSSEPSKPEEPEPESKPDLSSDSNTGGVTISSSDGESSGSLLGQPEPSSAEMGLISSDSPEKIVAPSSDFLASSDESASGNKYGQMLEAALAETNLSSHETTPTTPVMSPQEVDAMLSPTTPAISLPTPTPAPTTPEPNPAPSMSEPTIASPAAAPDFGANPAVSFAPTVPTEPEINGVPEMNFNMPDDILPPPPAPSIDANLPPMPDVLPTDLNAPTFAPTASPLNTPTAPSVPAAPDLPSAPTTPPQADAGAFKIPTANP